MKQQTFEEKYAPMRLAAYKKHYESPQRKRFATIEDARPTKGKLGNWTCLVQFIGEDSFYTCVNFKEKWVAAGWVLGMWNELTLIEKTSKKSKKVILELYMEIWYCYEDGKSMAYPLFTTTTYEDADSKCQKRKYEVIQVIDLELQDLED